MKNKNILLYLSSFIFLVFGFAFFLLSKFIIDEKGCITYSVICLLLFCIMNFIGDKKIRCKDGYNLFQAYLFYRKCKKKGVKAKSNKLRKNDMEIIADIAKKYDYCKNFTDEQLKELYRCGEDI